MLKSWYFLGYDEIGRYFLGYAEMFFFFFFLGGGVEGRVAAEPCSRQKSVYPPPPTGTVGSIKMFLIE